MLSLSPCSLSLCASAYRTVVDPIDSNMSYSIPITSTSKHLLTVHYPLLHGPLKRSQSISALDSELSNKRQRKDKAGNSAATGGAATNGSTSAQKGGKPQGNGNNSNNGRPNLNRQKSGGGKGANGKQSQAKTAPAAKAAPSALSPEEEEKRRKRAERFNAAS